MFVKSINPLLRIFLLMGLIQLVYDKNTKQFQEKRILIVYSICLTLLFQGTFYATLTPLIFSHDRDIESFLRAFVELSEALFWIANNILIAFSILTTRKTQCWVLNELLRLERAVMSPKIDWASANQSLKTTVNRFILLLFIYFIVLYPPAIYVCFVIVLKSALTLPDILGCYLCVLQFIFGNLYQMVIYQKLCLNFRAIKAYVEKNLNSNRPQKRKLRQVMETFCKMWVLSRRMVKTGRYSYVGCLIGVNYLMSFYLYYEYLNLDTIGSMIVWIAATSLTFFSCYYWGMVCHEVSL